MAKARKHYDCLKPFWGRKRISDSPPRTGICAGGSTGLGSAPPNWGPSCSTVTNQVTTGGLQSHRSHQGTNHEVQLCHGFPGERETPGKPCRDQRDLRPSCPPGPLSRGRWNLGCLVQHDSLPGGRRGPEPAPLPGHLPGAHVMSHPCHHVLPGASTGPAIPRVLPGSHTGPTPAHPRDTFPGPCETLPGAGTAHGWWMGPCKALPGARLDPATP